MVALLVLELFSLLVLEACYMVELLSLLFAARLLG